MNKIKMGYIVVQHVDELYHYGVKGMKWGVRHDYTRAAPTRSSMSGKNVVIKKTYSTKENVSKTMATTLREVSDRAQTYLLGKNKVDTYIKAGTTLSRIQSNSNFEKQYAYYATYKKHDINQYSGLFGKNLISRANAMAKAAEKQAKLTGREEDIIKAQELRKKADETNIHRLEITNTDKLRIPSDRNAADVLLDCMKDESFKDDFRKSLDNSQAQMKRPIQQALFKEANMAFDKDPRKMRESDKIALYKAANLSLTFHDDYHVRMQSKYYSALKKKGYSALLDTNDHEYSSYHAHKPVIVFDTSSSKLASVSKMDPKKIEKLYKVYNTERLIKEIPANVIKVPKEYGRVSMKQVSKRVNRDYEDYMGVKKNKRN